MNKCEFIKCGKLFDPKTKVHRCCSHKCSDRIRYNRGRELYQDKKCPNCFLLFEPVNRVQRYCSQKCKNKKNYKAIKKVPQPLQKICLNCKVEFETTSGFQKFCKSSCRTKSYGNKYKSNIGYKLVRPEVLVKLKASNDLVLRLKILQGQGKMFEIMEVLKCGV